MDLIDRATQHAERMLAAQLDNQLGRSLHHGESLHHCEECGDPIPAARRLHVPGVRLCVSCKSRAEQRGQ
ncbi:TraR/DksA family transcriptional regulator [Aeromonas dhakensis]|uniref:TraR/DksA family transcriptional regulator n=1 Tax=Aeromonas dhakensis TaxID=196024 RepID=UPI0027A0AFBD|nr:zinc finger protein [Aeromonas phage P05B]